MFDRGSQMMRRYLALAEDAAPSKSRDQVLLAAARSEDDPVLCEKILRKAVAEAPSSWKLHAELSLLLLRLGNVDQSQTVVKNALFSFPQIGRLWALYGRVLGDAGEKILDAALVLIPRSGELWVERARAHARKAEWGFAEECFRKGMVYTPQFGDVFIEMARFKLLRCLASRFGIGALRKDIPIDEIRSVVENSWDTAYEEKLCVLLQPNHGFVYDVVQGKLSRTGNISSLFVLAKAKMEMAEMILNNDNMSESFVKILYK